MKQAKRWLGIAVLVLTIAAFVYYWRTHPALWQQLRTTPLLTVLTVLVLYGVMLLVLVWIYDITVKLCKTTISFKEQTLLTMYSSIVNFFGPLQSGPGFRALYLKQKHAVKIRTYASMTLIYYGFFAFFSGLFLLSGGRSWWKNILLLGGAGIVVALGLKYGKVKRFQDVLSKHLSLRLVSLLAVATLLQVFIVSLIYFTELRSIDSHITFSQTLVYTGAANFALFVSLTPGALGFREAFLYFSRNLHHINNDTIIAANVIDRSVYLIFLGCLLVIILAIHGKDKLQISNKRVE